MLHNGSAPRDDESPAGRLSRRRLLRIGAVGALGSTAAAALAACGEAEPRIVTTEVPVEKIVTQTVVKEVPVDRVVEKIVTVEKMMAPQQQTVTVYSGRSESLVAPVLAQFGEISGVDVQIKYAGTPALTATLLEEGSNSPADLFYAQDPGGLGAVEPLFAPLPQDILDRIPCLGPAPRWPLDRRHRTGPHGRLQQPEVHRGRPPRRHVWLPRLRLERPHWLGPHQWLLPGHGHRHARRLG